MEAMHHCKAFVNSKKLWILFTFNQTYLRHCQRVWKNSLERSGDLFGTENLLKGQLISADKRMKQKIDKSSLTKSSNKNRLRNKRTSIGKRSFPYLHNSKNTPFVCLDVDWYERPINLTACHKWRGKDVETRLNCYGNFCPLTCIYSYTIKALQLSSWVYYIF